MTETIPSRRFLLRDDFHRLPQIFTDALVIGSGAAGLRSAIGFSEFCSVMVVTKQGLDDCATKKAQGGVALAAPSAGGEEAHVADTVSAGDGLCDEETVRFIVSRSRERIDELLSWGAEFDREDGELALTREGGHTAPRIVHARGDATGREIEQCLISETKRRDAVTVLENCFVVDLVADAEGCYGAVVLDSRGELKVIRSAVTVIASGGGGQVYRETTAPDVLTGDGLAMAYRAGAVLTDMEFVQFHPTTLYVAGAARALISEVLRGEGGILLDLEGNRFMQDYHPDGELASRDIVCRAVLDQMRKTNSTHVLLDVSHLPTDLIERRFPEITELCAGFDIDIQRDSIPVRPAVHYMMGGIRTDLNGKTDVLGLYACGEAACTGFHGGNRLGSNSLLEALVMGHSVAESAREEVGGGVRSFGVMAADTRYEPRKDVINVVDVRNSLQSLMTRRAGIERDAYGLGTAKQFLEFWSRYVMERDFDSAAGWEAQNMLTVARLIVRAASVREESRGAHHRTDFPETLDEWTRHIDLQREKNTNGT